MTSGQVIVKPRLPDVILCLAPLAGSTIENVHFIKNIENTRRLRSCDEKLRLETRPRATRISQNKSVREYQMVLKSRRMDFEPDDFARGFNVPPGCLSVKETRRN